MNLRNDLLMLCCFLFSTAGASAEQTISERAILKGRVFDAQTDAPLQNVVVWIQGTDQTTETDEEGRFELAGIAAGRHVLCLSAVNYTFVRREIEVVAGSDQDLTIPMFGGAATYSETVTVIAPLHRETEPIPTVQTLNGIPLQKLSSGVIDDPVRAVQALPGVVTGDDFVAEYSVRGKGPENIGASFEGVPALCSSMPSIGMMMSPPPQSTATPWRTSPYRPAPIPNDTATEPELGWTSPCAKAHVKRPRCTLSQA